MERFHESPAVTNRSPEHCSFEIIGVQSQQCAVQGRIGFVYYSSRPGLNYASGHAWWRAMLSIFRRPRLSQAEYTDTRTCVQHSRESRICFISLTESRLQTVTLSVPGSDRTEIPADREDAVSECEAG